MSCTQIRSYRRAAVLTIGTALLLFQSAHASAARRKVLYAGTVIPVQIDQTLNSKTAAQGDRFTATVRPGSDDPGLPDGTRIDGVVREAVPAEHGKPGVLDLDFRGLVLPNGERHAITADLIALNAKSVRRTASGVLVATPDKSANRLKFIGIGAGAGLLIGALTKQNTLESLLLGAGGGYLYNELSRHRPGDVNLKAGTTFGVRLDRSVAFDTNSGRPTDYDRGGGFQSVGFTRVGQTTFHQRIGVLINNRNVYFETAPPYQRNGITYIPLAPVAKAANLDFSYDDGEKRIRMQNGLISLNLGSRLALANGEGYHLKAAAEMHDGTLYVPADFIALAIHGSVYWDAGNRTLVFTTDRE